MPMAGFWAVSQLSISERSLADFNSHLIALAFERVHTSLAHINNQISVLKDMFENQSAHLKGSRGVYCSIF